jgi:DNA primase
LQQHPLSSYALAELARRQLEPSRGQPVADALRAFRVGYAPHGWDGLSRHLRQSGFNLRAAEAVGLIGERKSGDGYYDRFRHRLMFAVVDLQGRVIAFSGRRSQSLPPEELQRQAGTAACPRGGQRTERAAREVLQLARVAHLPQARRGVRPVSGAAGGSRAGSLRRGRRQFRRAELACAGLKNVVAPLGTAFTVEQARQIARYTRNVTFLFRRRCRGPAGHRGRARALPERGAVSPRVARLPKGVDPDELVRRGRQGRDSNACSRAPRALLEHLIDVALGERLIATDDAAARAGKIREVNGVIDAEEDSRGARHGPSLPLTRSTDARQSWAQTTAAVMRTLQSAVGRLGPRGNLSESPGRHSCRAPPERASGSPPASRVDADFRYQILRRGARVPGSVAGAGDRRLARSGRPGDSRTSALGHAASAPAMP